MKNWILKDEPATPPDPKTARTKATLLSLPFAMPGILAFILLVHDGLLGGLDRQKLFTLLSAMAAGIGFIALIFGITGKKGWLTTKPGSPVSENSERPWLRRKDWAAGRIKSEGFPHAKSYLIMGIGLCVLGGLIAALVVPKALQSGSYSALVALVFPAVGIVFLTSVVRRILAHRRFGNCFFEMTAVPAPMAARAKG